MRKTEHKHREYSGVLKGKSRIQKIRVVFVALLPIVLSAAWLIALALPAKYTGGYALGPSRSTTPLIIGLVIFIIGYLTFLSMMFSVDIKDWYVHLTKHKAN